MLQPEELAELEATLLPALERHHLRLLAHGLRTLQAIAARRQGPCPDAASIQAWCAGQPLIAADPPFAAAFASQLQAAAAQLEAIAAAAEVSPLALSLHTLTQWAVSQADTRVRPEPTTAPGLSPADPPPG